MLWKPMFTGRNSGVVKAKVYRGGRLQCCESPRLREETAVLWQPKFTGGNSSVVKAKLYGPNKQKFYYSFHAFCMFIKDNNSKLSNFQTGKIHENFSYFIIKHRVPFQNFLARREGPGRGLGGLYSIECPRIGGKKTISLKRYFSPTRAPAGPPQNLIYPHTVTWGPSIKAYKGENTTRTKSIHVDHLRELRPKKK